MNTVQIFNYKDSNVTFRNEDGITYVNATEMAKNFGKEVRQWFDNPGTHEFINAIAAHKGIDPMCKKRTSLNTSSLANMYPTLLKVVKGGLDQQGTWMHEDVALEFSRWLSPDFAIWCNDRIKELLKYGATFTQGTLEQIIDNPAHSIDLILNLATEIKKERCANAELAKSIYNKQKEIDKLKPKVELMDKVLDADEKIDIGQAAKILNLPFGRNTLFQKLRDKGVFFKNRNEPKQEYIHRGFFQLKEKYIERNEHDGFVVIKVLVTQRGLEYLAGLFDAVKGENKKLAHVG